MKKLQINTDPLRQPNSGGAIHSTGIRQSSTLLSIPGKFVDTVQVTVVVPVPDVVVPFSPNNLLNLIVWLKSSVGVTGTSQITDWADQSGNSFNMTASIGQEPALVAAVLNGFPAVSTYGLTGIRKMSTISNFADLSAGGTVFFVGKQDSIGGSIDGFGCWLGAGGFVNMQIERGSTSSLGFGSVGGAISSIDEVETAGTIPENTFVTVRLLNNVTDNKICYNNGTPVVLPSTVEVYQNTVLQLFKTQSGAQGNKEFTEIIIYNRTLTDIEILHVETYLKNKYAHY